MKLLALDSNTWNPLNVSKQMSSTFSKIKLPTNYYLTNQIYIYI